MRLRPTSRQARGRLERGLGGSEAAHGASVSFLRDWKARRGREEEGVHLLRLRINDERTAGGGEMPIPRSTTHGRDADARGRRSLLCRSYRDGLVGGDGNSHGKAIRIAVAADQP